MFPGIPETGRAAVQPSMHLNEVCNHLRFVFKVKLFGIGFLLLATKNLDNVDAKCTASSTVQRDLVVALFFQISLSISLQH